ncbi:MAG: L-threonylcarbamoyladenylate synthase [bacterium]|nr:L-threonylcarbamoyladenylate synthase [bacterium]
MTADIITEAVRILESGGIVAHATETCYGLACDLSNPAAVAKLFALKQRPEHMPVSALFESVDQTKQYIEWNDPAQKLADEYLPGPLTIILRAKDNTLKVKPATRNPTMPRLRGAGPQPATIGIRISSHPTAQTLVKAFGKPISTTSANIHGQPNTYSIEQIQAQGLIPDFIIDSGELPKMPSSKVIDLSEGKERILRS